MLAAEVNSRIWSTDCNAAFEAQSLAKTNLLNSRDLTEIISKFIWSVKGKGVIWIS